MALPRENQVKLRVSHTRACVSNHRSRHGIISSGYNLRKAFGYSCSRNPRFENRERGHGRESPRFAARESRVVATTIVRAKLSDLVESSARYTHVNGITSFCGRIGVRVYAHGCAAVTLPHFIIPVFQNVSCERRGTWTFLGTRNASNLENNGTKSHDAKIFPRSRRLLFSLSLSISLSLFSSFLALRDPYTNLTLCCVQVGCQLAQHDRGDWLRSRGT